MTTLPRKSTETVTCLPFLHCRTSPDTLVVFLQPGDFGEAGAFDPAFGLTFGKAVGTGYRRLVICLRRGSLGQGIACHAKRDDKGNHVGEFLEGHVCDSM